jgi:DNA-binding NtrC family response regulator
MAKAHILVIDDEEIMREYVEETLLRAGHDVQSASSGQDGIDLLQQHTFDVVVSDLKMKPVGGMDVLRWTREHCPSTHVIIMTAYGTVETAVTALKRGATDYILKPFAPDELELAVTRSLEREQLERENQYLRTEANHAYDFQAMVGESGAMRDVYDQIAKIASSRATVLIRGESGTGKELVARALHYSGNRAKKPFIKVNCAALSAGLLESELFGHEKGSFTGAHERKIGRFELADHGTLLLDEVSEISSELQPKLLRALQEREFERVGGSSPIQVDTRIVATSNRDLEEAVAEGTVREDLFFRLNVIPVYLPPLRDRKEDITALMDLFMTRFAHENARNLSGFTHEARDLFMDYDWPGNVRELQNTIERAVVLSSGPELEAEDFALGGVRVAGGDDEMAITAGTTVAQMERTLILHTLEHCNQNRTHAAKALGISVRTLRNKLKEYRVTEQVG